MGVQTYLNAIANGRGMAKSNLYSVYFGGEKVITELEKNFNGLRSKAGDRISKVGERVLLMCDEVSLPGIQSSTGSVVRHPGSNPIYYPTNPIYNDLQLSFMCDSEMQALNFLVQWREKIYKKVGNSSEPSYQVNYPEDYQCTLYIEKNERSSSSEIGQTPVTYTVKGAWPYSLDSIPLSYGSSQLVKVTANFYYRNWSAEFSGLKTIT